MILKQRPYKPYSENEISIRRDEIFKIALGTNERFQYLKDFLEGVLHRKITNIIIKNDVPIDKIHADNKLMRLDILVEVENQNGKEIKTLFFVYADNEKSAKDCLLTYKLIRPIKYNLTTLANAQVAYKKQFGVDVELDSVEFVDYTRK